jgi:hypothetical protein
MLIAFEQGTNTEPASDLQPEDGGACDMANAFSHVGIYFACRANK